MALLTKEQILAADDLKEEIVPCPEWGGDVRVVTMDGPTRERFDVSITGKEDDERNLLVNACAFSIHGENGKLLFSPDEINALGKKSSVPLMRVFQAARRVSYLFQDDELKKKSETPPSSGGSDSPSSGDATGEKPATGATP